MCITQSRGCTAMIQHVSRSSCVCVYYRVVGALQSFNMCNNGRAYVCITQSWVDCSDSTCVTMVMCMCVLQSRGCTAMIQQWRCAAVMMYIVLRRTFSSTRACGQLRKMKPRWSVLMRRMMMMMMMTVIFSIVFHDKPLVLTVLDSFISQLWMYACCRFNNNLFVMCVPPIDNIWAVITVWRLKWKISTLTWTVLCLLLSIQIFYVYFFLLFLTRVCLLGLVYWFLCSIFHLGLCESGHPYPCR